MDHIKKLLDECSKNNWIPKHDCSKNKKILSKLHSVNSLHNIVIAQDCQCIICGRQWKEEDPNGLERRF